MDERLYHSYLFFDILPGYHQVSPQEQDRQKRSFAKLLDEHSSVQVTPYVTLGLKTNTVFMLWCRAVAPFDIQTLVRDILRTPFGQWVSISYSYFGILRPSTYSGRTGKPEQEIKTYADRLPYLVLYPFTKTTEWYQLDFENRRHIMGQHIKTGVAHAEIRQCLLHAYGVDDYEFLVSYETATLEEFQDLVMEMRKTVGRIYTLRDTPVFTCTYMPLKELVAWL